MTISVVRSASGAIGANAIGRMWPRGPIPSGGEWPHLRNRGGERAACDLMRRIFSATLRARLRGRARRGRRRRPGDAGFDRRPGLNGGGDRRRSGLDRRFLATARQSHGDHRDADGRRTRLKAAARTGACDVGLRSRADDPRPERRVRIDVHQVADGAVDRGVDFPFTHVRIP